jgi:hypothetical protein
MAGVSSAQIVRADARGSSSMSLQLIRNASTPYTGAINGSIPAAVSLRVGIPFGGDGNPIEIEGLWSLRFGNGVFGTPNDLVFTAGIADESHGLMGEIDPAS